MYIAVTFIGGKYTPGEVISEDMPREQLEWLIRAGAVRKAAPAQAISIAPASAEETPAEAAREGTDSAGDAAGEDAGRGDEDAEDAAEDATEDEIDEERKVNLPEADLSPADAGDGSGDIEDIDFAAEAPEIDVMAGIVQGDAEETAKPAAKRKPTANSGGRRTPKGGKAK